MPHAFTYFTVKLAPFVLAMRWSVTSGWKTNYIDWKSWISVNIENLNSRVNISYDYITGLFGYLKPSAVDFTKTDRHISIMGTHQPQHHTLWTFILLCCFIAPARTNGNEVSEIKEQFTNKLNELIYAANKSCKYILLVISGINWNLFPTKHWKKSVKLSLLIQINASKIKSNHIDFVNNRSYLFQLIRLKGQIKLLRNTISMSSGTCVLVCVDMPLSFLVKINLFGVRPTTVNIIGWKR